LRRTVVDVIISRFKMSFRSAFLALIGVVGIIYGSGIVVASGYNPDMIHWWPGSVHRLAGMPILTWGIIWCCVGSFMLGSLFSLPRWDRAQFAVAAALNGCWAALSIQRSVISGEPGAWAPAAIYGGIAIAILIISAWPEPIPEIVTGEVITRAESARDDWEGS
jgi:hypothetical protein